jgi:hypothetical protein
LSVRVQIALGIVFAAAAIPKIADPPAFAHMVYNYRMVPGGVVNGIALVLPWVELLGGIALVLGVWKREAAFLVGLLLVFFIAAIGFNLARGHAIDCGCFDLRSAGKSREQLLSDMRWVLIRDVGLLLLVAQVAAATRTPRWNRP